MQAARNGRKQRMAENSAICFKFNIDEYPSLKGSARLEKSSGYSYLPRILKIAAAFNVRFQFCSCLQGVMKYSYEHKMLVLEGHPVDLLLDINRMVLPDKLTPAFDRLLLTEVEFEDNRIPWSGVSSMSMSAVGIDGCPEVINLLSERGYQWCSTRNDKSLSLEEMQPYWLNEYLLEIPSAGISDEAFFSDGTESLKDFIKYTLEMMLEAKQKGVIYTIDLHPGLLSKFDPECDFIVSIVQHAVDAGIPVVTMDQISQWYITNKELEESCQIPAFQQYLKKEKQWYCEQGCAGNSLKKEFDYICGSRLFPNYKFNGVNINSFGLRGGKVQRTKPAGKTRILCTGDSCVFGFSPDNAPWPEQLQHIFDLRTPQRCQVLNAGVGGDESIHLLKRLPRLLEGLRPDITIISIMANDMWNEKLDEELDDEESLLHYYPRNFMDNIQQIIDICLKNNVKPILCTSPSMIPVIADMTPYMMLVYNQVIFFGKEKQPKKMRLLYDRYNQAVLDIARTNGITCFDISTYFDEHLDDVRGRLFLDTCHLLKEGYEEIARFIADKLSTYIA